VAGRDVKFVPTSGAKATQEALLDRVREIAQSGMTRLDLRGEQDRVLLRFGSGEVLMISVEGGELLLEIV